MPGDVLELSDAKDAVLIGEKSAPVTVARPNVALGTEYVDDGRLMPSRGIALGILISLPIWALIIWGIRSL